MPDTNHTPVNLDMLQRLIDAYYEAEQDTEWYCEGDHDQDMTRCLSEMPAQFLLLIAELRSARAAIPAEPCEVVIEPGSPVTEQDIEAARAWTWPYAMPTDPEVRERLDRQLRAATPGPDSRDAEQAVTFAFADVSKLPEWMQVPALGRDMTPLGELAAAALRAAGLLPGPDTIPVNREALWQDNYRKLRTDVGRKFLAACYGPDVVAQLLAFEGTQLPSGALSEPPAPKEQQP